MTFQFTKQDAQQVADSQGITLVDAITALYEKGGQMVAVAASQAPSATGGIRDSKAGAEFFKSSREHYAQQYANSPIYKDAYEAANQHKQTLQSVKAKQAQSDKVFVDENGQIHLKGSLLTGASTKDQVALMAAIRANYNNQ